MLNKVALFMPGIISSTHYEPHRAEKNLLIWVLNTVKDANNVAAEELDALRAQDWSDQDILEALNHGARMVAGDIIFNAFKVSQDY